MAANSDAQPALPARTVRLAYVVSHPIQYQAPLLRRIAAEPGIDLTVYFASDFSLRAYRDRDFNTDVAWDVPLTGGYRSVVLPRLRDTDSPSSTRPIAFGYLRHFLRWRPDAVWVHGYASVNALHAIVAARLLGVPVLLRNDGWLGDRVRTGRTLLAKTLFFRWLESMTAGTLAAGTLNRAYWRAYFGDRVPSFWLPYAVDNAFFRERAATAAATRAELRAELGIAADSPVILFAGKLQQRKHADHLLEAFLRLPATLQPADTLQPAPTLLIVGDGEQHAALRERAAASDNTRIVFAGFRNQSELPRFFDLCSVFVLPARHEPWGLIVNEVMNAARPVIVTDEVGAAPDLVLPGQTGWVYPAGDVDALTRALHEAVSDPARSARMGRAAQQLVAAWDFEADVRGLREALATLTGRIRA